MFFLCLYRGVANIRDVHKQRSEPVDDAPQKNTMCLAKKQCIQLTFSHTVKAEAGMPFI
ncbi:hypothetical protein NC651_035755 [Populus alba x Populus x berolinensis]|nr:hypothetical protein NC651_035755 [Populus alba x Populus x berolinensis]